MKPRLLSLFCSLLLLICQAGFPQDAASRFSLVVSPALLQPINLALQGGVQWRTGSRSAVVAEVAFPLLRGRHETFESMRVWRAGLEYKVYRSNIKLPGPYISLQTTWLSRLLTDENSGEFSGKNSRYQYDAAVVLSPVWAMAIKLGKEFTSARERKVVDLFAGLGVRRIFNQYQAVNERPVAGNGVADKFGWFIPMEGWSYNYPLIRFHFTVGFRVGFKLRP